MDCISLSHCMLISVVGYRPCTYTKCEKLIHSSLPPFFEFCPKFTIKMTQHTTTCFVLGHFTFSYNAKIKIILQLQDKVKEFAAFEIQYIIQFTQKNKNLKLTQGTSPYRNMLGKTLCTLTYIMQRTN